MGSLKRKEPTRPAADPQQASHKKVKLQRSGSRPHQADLRNEATDDDEEDFLIGVDGRRPDEHDASLSPDGPDADAPDHVEPEPEPEPSKSQKPSTNIKPSNHKINPSTTSAEAHAAQRALAKERKASKPNADMIQRLKKIWERLRRQSHVPLEERKQLVTELFEIIGGNIRDLVFKHDSVRVVQCGLKYANRSQRLQVAQELQKDYLALAESKYGKFLVAKLIVEGDRDVRAIVIPSFYGHVRRLINHPEAAWIMDDIYRQVAITEQKAMMLREWYSAEYAILGKTRTSSSADSAAQDKPTADLASILAASPEKKRSIMQYLFQLINQLVQKKLTAFTMLHDAMLQYLINTVSDSAEQKEFFELLKSDLDDETTKATSASQASSGGDLLKSLSFTKSGARIVRLALAHGTAKDRKVILRVYKDLIPDMAADPNAHTVLLAAMDVTDDTKLTAKAILSELLGEGIAEAETKDKLIVERLIGLHAHVVMLYPLAGLAKSLFSGDQRAMMEEVHAIRATTSKKDPETRRQELVKYMSPSLLRVVSDQTGTLAGLMQATFGSQAITEIISNCQGDKTEACQAIAASCAGPISPDAKGQPHIASSAAAGKMLKTLVHSGRFDPVAGKVQKLDPPLGFADMFYANIAEHLIDWAVGPSSLVVAALLESSETSKKVKASILASLTRDREKLEKASKETNTNGSAPSSKHGKAVKGKSDGVRGGNSGVKILLAILDQ